MAKKLRQITDSIHQTVYLSEMESKMMSTAYFYRLHDVYQSSTVYLTYPCNRTKRYEHSYGTMEIAGKMFFSAVTNAEEYVLQSFFNNLESYSKKVIEEILRNKHPTYCNSSIENLSKCFTPVRGNHINENINIIINDCYKKYEVIEDIALNHYMPPFQNEISKRKFLYQCILEAIRIVALFHDVGHPPFSHILESVLDELYDSCDNENSFDHERCEELLNSLKPFKDSNENNINCLISKASNNKKHIHEQVGFKMLSGSFEQIFSNKLVEITKIKDMKVKSTVAIYYLIVAEFCFAILRENDSFFTSLHRIISGCIDADRMDYIVRDSVNSGVNWGKIPYKRIIESCKMIIPNNNEDNEKNFYLIAYPSKMTDDIDDLLITRYKIFSRINYHHRSFKTALILQELVTKLSYDYLKKNEEQKALCPGIADLWNCLSSTLNSNDLYIIQWNDSTLISHLYQTLVEIKGNSYDDYNLSPEEYDIISHMLEEFLLNKKYFYSVFKRQSDFIPIYKKVLKKLDPYIKKILKHEKEKIEKIKDNKERTIDNNANDSLNRIKVLDNIIKIGDIDAFERVFPSADSLSHIIPKVLEQFKENNKISSYLFAENKKRSKLGLPNKEDEKEDKFDQIYLYDTNSEPTTYDVSSLESQIITLQIHCLQYIAYIEISDSCENIIQEIHNSIEDELYKSVSKSMEEIFPFLNNNNST